MGNFSMDFLEKVSRSVDVSYWLLLVVRLKASPAKQWCGGSFICTVCFIVFPERSAKDQTSIKEWSMWAWRSVLATDDVADSPMTYLRLIRLEDSEWLVKFMTVPFRKGMTKDDMKYMTN